MMVRPFRESGLVNDGQNTCVLRGPDTRTVTQ